MDLTSLHMACSRGNKDLAELLITKGVDVNARDRRGQTALDYEQQAGFSEITEVLRKHGAKE
jgi:ankyrin repeat protein